jgi:DNA-binding NarL/FixJ family response regulator
MNAEVNHSLSPREVQVLGLLRESLSNRTIGSRLNIAEATVKVHFGHIFKAIKVTNRTAASSWAHQHPEVFQACHPST